MDIGCIDTIAPMSCRCILNPAEEQGFVYSKYKTNNVSTDNRSIGDKMKTIIMAGGKGTRISELFPDIPKPLIPITNSDGITKSVLEWEIESLRKQGFTDIIITVSYMAERIEECFGNGDRLGVNIEYYVEKTPMGNAGALLKLREKLTDDFLLLNSDAVFEVDFNRMLRWHKNKDALVTLFTHPNSHPFDSGIIIADEKGAVEQWLSKEDDRPLFYKNCVNAGLHIVNPKVINMSDIDSEQIGMEIDGKPIKVDLDRHILKPLCGSGRMYAYESSEYVKDMGTPERYDAVCHDFKSGLVGKKSLSQPQKAIFLDRDGIINKYVGFVRSVDEFELIEGVQEAIRLINESGYLAIVITNQPVVARGEITVDELNEIHKKMETRLGEAGAYIDALYYCPHHPDKGFEGEIPELKIECECRKPRPGLLVKAAKEYNISLEKSWMIGDGERDILAGKAAGCKTIFVGNDYYGQDMTATSLLNAVKEIMRINESENCRAC